MIGTRTILIFHFGSCHMVKKPIITVYSSVFTILTSQCSILHWDFCTFRADIQAANCYVILTFCQCFSQNKLICVVQQILDDELFCGMVDRQEMISLISSWDHCQRCSSSQISFMPRVGFELPQNLSSGFVEWSCPVVRNTIPRLKKMFAEHF